MPTTAVARKLPSTKRKHMTWSTPDYRADASQIAALEKTVVDKASNTANDIFNKAGTSLKSLFTIYAREQLPEERGGIVKNDSVAPWASGHATLDRGRGIEIFGLGS